LTLARTNPAENARHAGWEAGGSSDYFNKSSGLANFQRMNGKNAVKLCLLWR
jgi:hypothetical protein